MGIPCELIPPKKVAQLHPLINIHDLVGAMYVPEDAVVSSADVSLALARAASVNGMAFHTAVGLLGGMPVSEFLEVGKDSSVLFAL